MVRTELLTEQFYNLQNVVKDISQSPWYVNTDGNLFFVKDKTEEVRELTPQEHRKFSRISYGAPISYKYER